jgi:GAF domain/PilZ domain/Sel1 repeat
MEPTGPNLAGTSRQSGPATERRHTMRHRAHSPAYARLNAAQAGAPDLSEILDISEDGMSIQTSSPLDVERHLSLSLDLSETGAPIRTTGKVVWSESSGRAGIRFAKLSGQSLDQLKEWLFVNILTAVDHAGATSADQDRWNNASKGLPPSHTILKGEFVSETLVISGNRVAATRTGVPRGAAVRAEGAGSGAAERTTERESDVESIGFDRETALQSIAERALSLTRATGAAIALSQGNDNEMTCVASAGSDAPPVGSRLQVGSGFSGECVRTGRSLRCDDSETDDRVDRAGCKALGIRSLVAVPIRTGTKVAGLLEVFSPQPYAFNADDIGALQQLTGSILSTTGHSAETRASSAIQVTPPPPPQPARPPRIEKRPAPKAETIEIERPAAAAKPSTQPSLHKALFVAAIGTFVFALLWLIAPWVSSTMRSAERTTAHVQPTPATLPKSPNLPASAGDLVGLSKVAEHGDPAAQFALGARYATGEDVKQDYTEAVRWFTLAAEQGHIVAQATLGAYYWAGRGVPQDLNKAYYWSVLAQAGGDQASKYRVAVLASRMSRGQVVAAQQQADDWLRNFASHPPSTP